LLLAGEAARLIREQPKEKPFFLYVPFNAVHAPHQVPAKYKEPYAELPEPRRTYAGMVAAMDEAVGQIVNSLDEKKLRQDTLIIFASDNGGPQPGRVTSNGPLRAGKGTLYEGGVRVCAFATWEGHIKPGTIVNQPMHIADWYPTLLKLAGASLEQKLPLDGLDIWPAITQGKPSPHEEILLNAEPARGAIRVGDWKLVLNGGRSNEQAEEEAEAAAKKAGKLRSQPQRGENVELFNLADDPYEKNNLASGNPDKVTRLRAAYDRVARQAVPPKYAPKKSDFRSPTIWGEP
jgi:arylsulfatase A-like enzyme